MKYEAEIEKACVEWAKARHWKTVKLDTAKNVTGIPDRLFFGPAGTSIYVEFKRPEEKHKLSLKQWEWRDWLTANHYVYTWCVLTWWAL